MNNEQIIQAEKNKCLIEAIYLKDTTAAQQAIDNGADVDGYALEGMPMLCHAIFQLNVEMVKILLENGANTELSYYNSLSQGNTPLIIVASKGGDAVNGDENVISIIKLLLENGANINAQNSSGETPLHHATRAKQEGKSIQSLLIENGADRDLKNGKRKVPLDLLDSNNRTKVLEYWEYIPQNKINVVERKIKSDPNTLKQQKNSENKPEVQQKIAVIHSRRTHHQQ